MDRWPTKPPKGTKCDATIGSGTDALGAPVIYSCREEAVESVKGRTFAWELYMCTPHAEYFESLGQIQRNPKRRR